MFNYHDKWLKVTKKMPRRRPVASLNYLLTSHVWRQDHNGFSHQDPGFIDHVINKKADIVTYRRPNLPPHPRSRLQGRRHDDDTFRYVRLNDLDRFHLAMNVIDRVPGISSRAAYFKQMLRDKLLDHHAYIRQHGEDEPEISDWK